MFDLYRFAGKFSSFWVRRDGIPKIRVCVRTYILKGKWQFDKMKLRLCIVGPHFLISLIECTKCKEVPQWKKTHVH